VLTDLTGQRMTRISRKDVADFIVGETREPRFHQQTVNLTN
jgi:hypothetical protein